MTEPTDIRALAEKAIALAEKATGGQWEWDAEQKRIIAHVPECDWMAGLPEYADEEASRITAVVQTDGGYCMKREADYELIAFARLRNWLLRAHDRNQDARRDDQGALRVRAPAWGDEGAVRQAESGGHDTAALARVPIVNRLDVAAIRRGRR
jgi:hypothetical protein